MSSPGKILQYGQGAIITAQLYNFGVGDSKLKAEHSTWLLSVVAPKLRAGGSLMIVGLTSRTGRDKMNMKLSQKRARAVIDFLREDVPNNFSVAMEVAVGERAASFAGVPDGVEDKHWRSVIISAWDKPTPPPPPPPPPPQPAPPLSSVHNKFLTRWLGFGFKSGGQLLIGGVESVTAYLVNLGDFETFDLKIVSSRWGLGLGGSGGFVAVIGFGFSVPYEMHGKSVDDWGVNIAFTERLISKGMIKALQTSKLFMDGFKNGRYVAPTLYTTKVFAQMKQLEHLRNLLHTLYAALEASKRPGGVVVIDLPVVGMGLEVSAFLTRGTMYVSNPSHWVEPS
jgi:hypothetical protein